MASRFVCEAVPQKLECAVCSAPFTPVNPRSVCCGRECGNILGKRKGDATRSARVALERQRTCKQCGVAFSIKRLYGKLGEGQFCGRACRDASVRVYASSAEAKRAGNARRRERQGLPALLTSVACEVCSTVFRPRGAQRWCSQDCRRAGASTAMSSYSCVICAARFAYTSTGGKPRTTCGETCERSLKRAHRKAAKVRRKRVVAAVKIEVVHATKVFERDGWRCQGCRTKTPASLRGSWDNRAPELDHIVPLSAGGEHSYRNTQLLCRSCNIGKGAGPGGQLRLFG